MANTFTSLHYHITFSTKHRECWISNRIQERLWPFIGGIAREHGMKAIQVGGMPDHIHAHVGAPPKLGPSKIVQLLKGGSSAWMHETFPELRGTAWQDGFGAFTVSKSAVPDLIAYIRDQESHHRGMSFQEEFLALLKRHEIEYDERYLWG